METGSLSAIQITLLILAAPVVLIIAAYGLILFWRSKAQQAIREIGEQIQGYDSRAGEIHQFLAELSGTTEEPYAAHLEALQNQVSELQTRLEAYLQASRTFEEEVQGARIHQLMDIINAPMVWFRRWRYSAQLRKESREIGEQLAGAEKHTRQVAELPWELAQRCRQAQKDLLEVTQAAQSLQEKGVRGLALQTILRQIPQMRQALDEIPPRFYEADQEALLATTSKKVTVRVFTIHNNVRPALDRYLPQVREWSTYQQKATAEFAELKQSGADLRQAIANPPAGLVITDLQSRLDQIAQMAGDISQRLTEPDADSLKPLSREIAQLRKVIQDTRQMLNRSSQQAGELSLAITALNDSLQKLSGLFSALERGDLHPMAWDRSSAVLLDLRKRALALGPAGQARTPEEIRQHLKEVEAIRSAYNTLSGSYPGIAEQYRTLTALLDSADLKEGAAWLRKAQEMCQRAALFDPRNWSKSDAIQALPADLVELGKMQEQFVPADRSTPVKETSLEQRLKDTQKLAGLHKTLRPRVESARARLEKIQALEAESKDRLTASFTALERVGLLTESNDLLFEITGNEIDRLSEEIRQAGNELSARAQGEVDRKHQKVQAVSDKINRALNGWLGKLNAAIAERGKSISDQLALLDAVGSLDEQPVIEAHQLLARDEYLSAASGSAPTGSTAGRLRDAVLQRQAALGDLEVTAEIKRKSDYWLTLLATQRAMEERTGTLLAAYQETVQARTEARERLAEAARRMPSKRAWPPNNQTQFDASQLMGPAEDRWQSMKTSIPRRIDTAVLEVGRLTQQYRLVTERASQAIERVDQDEERVKDLEEEIAQLKERWQAQIQADPNNPVIREGIRHLMTKADERLAFIRQQYLRGALSYEETIHNLRLLNDELFAARIPVDEKNDIGLNETTRRIGTP